MTDPTLQADIAEANEFWSRSPGSGNPLKDDPSARQAGTKHVIAGFYFERYRIGLETQPPEEWQWASKKTPEDFRKARRWFELELDQVQTEISNPPCAGACARMTIEHDHEMTIDLKRYIKICDDQLPENRRKEADRKAKEIAQEAARQESEDSRLAKEMAPLLARRKHVGDTVCNTSSMIVGQVDRVENDKILIRTHRHVNGYANTFAGTYTPARDWDESTWVDYNVVVICH